LWCCGYEYYNDKQLYSNPKEYKKLKKEFDTMGEYPYCNEFGTGYYDYVERKYLKSKKKSLKKEHDSTKVYLEDKLKYYDEVDFTLDEEIMKYFEIHVKDKLSKLTIDKPFAKSKWVLENQQKSLVLEKRSLQMIDKISSLTARTYAEEKEGITNRYVKNFKKAYSVCKDYHLFEKETTYPISYWHLYGGSGKGILQDDYEIDIFKELITKSKKDNNLKETKKLYLKFIKYQIIKAYRFGEDAQISIDEYLKQFDKKNLLKEINSMNNIYRDKPVKKYQNRYIDYIRDYSK
jgi:hypothetical protein